jgi:hypothetical protein
MYQEDVSKITADHLRSHIKAYLDEVSARYSGNKKLPLVVPKTIESASAVGGTMTEFNQILPAYGIDILNVSVSEDNSNLWSHQYDGQINGLVSGSSQSTVDGLIKRHAAAVEHFVRQHLLLHDGHPSALSNDFRILNFLAGNLEFSGAEDLGETDGQTLWLGAFSLNVIWLVSENGPDDHG